MGRGPGSPPSSLLAFRARALGHSSFVRLPVVWELVQQGVGPAMVPGGGWSCRSRFALAHLKAPTVCASWCEPALLVSEVRWAPGASGG